MAQLGRTYVQPVITRTAMAQVGGTTYDKTGGGVMAVVGSGVDATTHDETGTTLIPIVGSGADATSHDETGSGVIPVVGAGADATTHDETGGGIVPVVGSGMQTTSHFTTPSLGGGGDSHVPDETVGRPYFNAPPPDRQDSRPKPIPRRTGPPLFVPGAVSRFVYLPAQDPGLPPVQIPVWTTADMVPSLQSDLGEGEDEEMAAAYAILLLVD